MRIKELRLSNYQGLRDFVLNADGQSVSVYGDNGTGKTTIANAVSWVLFDKPYTGEKNYSPKTTDANGNDVHHLEHKAEIVFEQDSGAQIRLARVYKEEWKKKRGSNVEEFSGHLIENFVDGVPVSATEYKRTVEGICAPERAKILTSPRYFAEEMKWDKRRAILLELCGDVSDAEIIDGNTALRDLYVFLRKPGTEDQYYTVEEFLKIAASRKAELNKELTMIPARIDEATKATPDTSVLDGVEVIRADIAALEARKQELMVEIAAASSTSAMQALREELAQVRAEMMEAQAEYNVKHADVNAEYQRSIDKKTQQIAEIRRKIAGLKNKIELAHEDVTKKERQRADLLRKHAEIKARVWDGDTVCAACGQALPEDRIEEAKARFNQQRSIDLARINEDGQKCSASVIEEINFTIAGMNDEIEKCDGQIEEIEREIENVKKRIVDVPAFSTTAECAEFEARMARIRVSMNDVDDSTTEAKKATQAKIEALNEEIKNRRAQETAWSIAEKQAQRIEELEKSEKITAQQYENIERGVYLCEEFMRAKIAALDEKINERFQNVRFRLFRTLINGGLENTCDVLVPTSTGLTPWSSANNAARVAAGCEIADVLGEFWGINMVMVIDNAESIARPIQTNSQQIRLYVSAADKNLRVEHDD